MPITLHDSLSRASRPLAPGQPDGIYRFYNCGPTVYAAAHIGNFRTFVVNDLLRRLLDLEFPGKVKHVQAAIRTAMSDGPDAAAGTGYIAWMVQRQVAAGAELFWHFPLLSQVRPAQQVIQLSQAPPTVLWQPAGATGALRRISTPAARQAWASA